MLRHRGLILAFATAWVMACAMGCADEPAREVAPTVVSDAPPWLEQFRELPAPDVLPVPRVARTIEAGPPCLDPRYPVVTPGWFVVRCNEDGRPGWFTSLMGDADVHLANPAEAWAIDPLYDGVYGLGHDQGHYWLDGEGPRTPDRIEDAIAPPSLDGEGRHIAYVAREEVGRFVLGEPLRTTWSVRAAPWYPPAQSDGGLLFVETFGGEPRIVLIPPGASDPVVLDDAEGPVHHPVAAGQRAAWVHETDVIVADLFERTYVRYPADAGFRSAPVFVEDRVCWEDRAGGTPHVRCTDGWTGPGTHPSAGQQVLMTHNESWLSLYFDGAVGLQP